MMIFATNCSTLDSLFTATVKEDEILQATGRIVLPDSALHPEMEQMRIGTWGKLIQDQHGNWNYRLNNEQAAVQLLGDSDVEFDFFRISLPEGRCGALQVVVRGRDESISGDLSGQVRQDQTLSVQGQLQSSSPHVTFVEGDQNGRYGTLSVEENGEWVYELNHELETLRWLGPNEALQEVFPVQLQDGASSHLEIVVSGPWRAQPGCDADTRVQNRMTRSIQDNSEILLAQAAQDLAREDAEQALTNLALGSPTILGSGVVTLALQSRALTERDIRFEEYSAEVPMATLWTQIQEALPIVG